MNANSATAYEVHHHCSMDLRYKSSRRHEPQFNYSLQDLLRWEAADQFPIFREFVANFAVNIQYDQNLWQRVQTINDCDASIIRDLQRIIFDYIHPNALPGEDTYRHGFKIDLKSLFGLGICVSDKVLYYSEWEVCTHTLLYLSSNKHKFILQYGHEGWKGAWPNATCWDVLRLARQMKESFEDGRTQDEDTYSDEEHMLVLDD